MLTNRAFYRVRSKLLERFLHKRKSSSSERYSLGPPTLEGGLTVSHMSSREVHMAVKCVQTLPTDSHKASQHSSHPRAGYTRAGRQGRPPSPPGQAIRAPSRRAVRAPSRRAAQAPPGRATPVLATRYAAVASWHSRAVWRSALPGVHARPPSSTGTKSKPSTRTAVAQYVVNSCRQF